MRQRNKKHRGRELNTYTSATPQFTKNKLAVVVIALSSAGIAYPVIAADETVVNTNNPYATTTTSTDTDTDTDTPNHTTTAPTPSTPTQPTSTGLTSGTGTSKLDSVASPNPESSHHHDADASASVINNAESCVERMNEVGTEGMEEGVAMADATLDVDSFFGSLKESGCLVSFDDSISLANQIVSMDGGSLGAIVMSKVKDKISEASQKMKENLFAKGCEVMLQASQEVYTPINDVMKKYEVYANPNYAGDYLSGLIDSEADKAVFSFDNKVEEIGNKIIERDKERDDESKDKDGSLFEDGDPLGTSTGNQNLDDAEKAAIEDQIKTLLASRNQYSYPLVTQYAANSQSGQYDGGNNTYAFLKNIHLDPLRGDRAGSKIKSFSVTSGAARNGIRTGNEKCSSPVVSCQSIRFDMDGRNRDIRYGIENWDRGQQGLRNAIAAIDRCSYVASITVINKQVINLANKINLADPTLSTILQPANISSQYHQIADSNVKNATGECNQNNATSTGGTVAPPANGNANGNTNGENANNRTTPNTHTRRLPDYLPKPPANSGASTNNNTSSVPVAQPTTPTNSTSPTTNAETKYMNNRNTSKPSTENNSSEDNDSSDNTNSSNPFANM